MIDTQTRQAVRVRAEHRCEYYRLPEWANPIPFHIEHIRAKQHGGDDHIENLALACDRCNLHKGPNLTGIDPESNAVTALFQPREQAWPDHFTSDGSLIVGKTAIGRTTLTLLQMNAPRQRQLREAISDLS